MSSSRANPGRLAAVHALIEVEEGALLDDALERYAPTQRDDRGLAWFIAKGTLRHRGQVDAALRPHLRQPLTGLDAPVRACLRAGAFEKLFGRSPDRAVVHQAVEVAKRAGAKRAQGLVNAVLRRVKPATELSRSEALDHPAWLVARWTERYGAEAAEAWCQANGDEPPLFLVGTPDTSVQLGDRTLQQVQRVEPPHGPITEMPGFSEGVFWVQDAAAVAVADLVGAQPGQTVLDVCAAPGGKAFRMARAGATVTATDVSDERLARLIQSAERLHLDIATRVHDWTTPFGDETFDAVLVDAPCTGLGTVRRHPDIRWRRQEPDIEAAAARQRVMLGHASRAVKPGGTLVYAVCSPEPEEGREVVDALLAEHAHFVIDEILDTAPPVDGEDAHWAARLRSTG